jgi:hypothetical protein
MVKLPRLTRRGIRNAMGSARAERQGKAWAAPITTALRGGSSKGVSMPAAVAYYNLLHSGPGAVYRIARAEKIKARWMRQRLGQHRRWQRCMARYAQSLRRALRQVHGRLPPNRRIVMMYGSAAWGPQRGMRRAPVKKVLRWFQSQPDFKVCMVNEFRTSMVHWSNMQQRLLVTGRWRADGGKGRKRRAGGVGAGGRAPQQGAIHKLGKVRGFLRLPAGKPSTSNLNARRGPSGRPRYVGRDFNAAACILLAGRAAQRPRELRRDQGDDKVDYRIRAYKRGQGVRRHQPGPQ